MAVKILGVNNDKRIAIQYPGIKNQYIAERLGMKNKRSVANFLHGDYNLSEEKKRRAEELIVEILFGF